MKKKVIKKNVVKTAAPEDVDMPMAATDVDDVAEDHKVFDMSSIAAPVIEFELPNLTEKKIEAKPVKKTVKKVQKKTSEGQKPLTASLLNNELVRLRPTVLKAKQSLRTKLVKQKKALETRKSNREEAEKKTKRIVEEIEGLKSVNRDSVAKFAALNTKALNEQKMDANTSVEERLIFKLACQPLMVVAVEAIRQKYTEWNKTAAFFMQRLGLQYSNKPEKAEKAEKPGKPEKSKKAEEPESDADEEAVEKEEEEEEGDGEEGGDNYDESDVEMVDSDEEAGSEAASKRRNILLGLIGVKEDKSRPALKAKKRKIEEDDEDEEQTMVMKVDLSKGGEIASTKKAAKVAAKVQKVVAEVEEQEDDDDEESSAFFLPKSGKAAPAKKPVVKKEKKAPAPPPPAAAKSTIADKKKGTSKNKPASEAVHPSWAASQLKKKEMEAAKPCGKKITFGDDDD